MALVAHFDLELHQMDVKTAFLNGDIDETIYMLQPENFLSRDTKKMVCDEWKTPIFLIHCSDPLFKGNCWIL